MPMQKLLVHVRGLSRKKSSKKCLKIFLTQKTIYSRFLYWLVVFGILKISSFGSARNRLFNFDEYSVEKNSLCNCRALLLNCKSATTKKVRLKYSGIKSMKFSFCNICPEYFKNLHGELREIVKFPFYFSQKLVDRKKFR